MRANTDDALNKINVSDVAVLISNKNMIIFYPPIDKYFAEYEVSNVRFISAIVTINDVQHEIKLKTPDYSFYVVGNDLNVDFVRYYMRKFKNISLPLDVEYKLDLVDDNVKFFTLDQHECIAIEKDTYQIYTYREEEEEEKEEEEKEKKKKNWEKEETYDKDDEYDVCDDDDDDEEEEDNDGLPTLADIFTSLKIQVKHNNQYHYSHFIDKEDDEEDEDEDEDEEEDEKKEDEEDNSYVYPNMIGPS
jgi:hypothetical protein